MNCIANHVDKAYSRCYEIASLLLSGFVVRNYVPYLGTPGNKKTSSLEAGAKIGWSKDLISQTKLAQDFS